MNDHNKKRDNSISRREFIRISGKATAVGSIGLGFTAMFTPFWLSTCRPEQKRSNILFITVDDIDWASIGAYGCKVPDITPNIDKLANEGIRFSNAHVNIAVCQPSRESILTGRYPHRNGAMGFDPIRPDVPTFNELLRASGYMNGIVGKPRHYTPVEKFCWDMVIERTQLNKGRDPKLYYKYVKDFLGKAKKAGKPFFLHVNSEDAHRPLEKADKNSPFPYSSSYRPEEVEVPGFLPDIPDVRQEVTWYFNSVHRSDETVGIVLNALRESGMEDNTIVLFLSDNGMAFPFAKTNCYLNSTKTPLILRWPGRIKPGVVDQDHLVSGVDIMPMLIDVTGLDQINGMDGRSFFKLLLGKKHKDREYVYTMFNTTSTDRDYPMRSLLTKKFSYIYNAWSDGKTIFINESQNGLSMRAMKHAAEIDKEIAARVKLFLYRVPEEFYDIENDPNSLQNLIDDAKYLDQINLFRQELAKIMESTHDLLFDTFKKQVLR